MSSSENECHARSIGLVRVEDINNIELPRSSTRIEPLGFPADGTALDAFWRFHSPLSPASAEDGGEQVRRNGIDTALGPVLKDWTAPIWKDVVRRIREASSACGLAIDKAAMSGILEDRFLRHAVRLSTRAFVETFMVLKSTGIYASSVSMGFVLQDDPGRLIGAVESRYPRLSFRLRRVAKTIRLQVICLVRRLASNRQAVERQLGTASSIKSITGLQVVGDTHALRGAVTRLTIATVQGIEYRLMYKPRSLDVDQAFYELIGRMAAGGSVVLRAPWFLAFDQYGWMEYIEHRACTSLVQVRSYYHVLGWLSAVLHLLSARDIHAGNLVANGAHPVLVDLECLAVPPDSGAHAPEGTGMVTATSIIPMLRFASKDFPGMDICAFSGGGQQPHIYSEWYVSGIDHPLPSLWRRKRMADQGMNVPTLEGVRVNPFEFTDSFVGGFVLGYRTMLDKRPCLLSEHGWLSRLRGMTVRLVKRNTGEYVKALDESSAPSILHSRSAEYEHYRKALSTHALRSTEEEVRLLALGLVPRWTVRVDAPSQTGPGSGVSGLEHVRGVMTRASEDDMHAQVGMIRHCVGLMARNRRSGPSVDVAAGGAPDFAALIETIARHTQAAQISALEWHAAEVTHAGAWVATRAGQGFCTGVLGVIGADLVLRGRGLPGLTRAGPEVSLHALAERPLNGPVHGLEGQAGYVLLDTLATRADIDLLSHKREEVLERIGTAAEAHPGFSGVSGTLLLLSTSLELGGDESVVWAINRLLETSKVYQTLSQIAETLSRGGPHPVTTSSYWALVLAASRVSHSVGNARIRQICSDVLSRELSADGLDARLMRLLLWVSPSSEVCNRRVCDEWIDMLKHLSAGNPASQYGLGALIGVLLRASDRCITDVDMWSAACAAYSMRVDRVMKFMSANVHGEAALYDMARGMAGFALRMSDLHAKQSALSTVVF